MGSLLVVAAFATPGVGEPRRALAADRDGRRRPGRRDLRPAERQQHRADHELPRGLHLRRRRHEGTNDYATPDGSVSPITVTGLTNGSHYTCTITATDGTGASDPSPASNSVLVAGLPDAPAAPGVTAASSQITVSIGAAPADHGSAITGYTANCTSSDGGASGSNSALGASPSPIVVAPLTNGAHYTCTATATNGIGTSAASSASASVLVSGAPGSPARPTIVGSNSQIVVTYSAPADNGNPITGYSTTCSSNDGGSPGTNSFTGATPTPITVAPLQNGKHYTCTVTAANGNGAGPASQASTSILLGLPDAPPQPDRRSEQRPDRRHLLGTRRQRHRDHRLHRHLHRRHDPVEQLEPRRDGDTDHRRRAHQRPHLHVHRHRDEQHRDRSRLARIGIGGAERGCTRPTGGAHDRGRQRADRRHVHRARQQRQHDHRLHRHVHRRQRPRAATPSRRDRDTDHRHRAHQRPHLHVHRHRHQQCRYRTGVDTARPRCLLGLPSAPAQPTITPGTRRSS